MRLLAFGAMFVILGLGVGCGGGQTEPIETGGAEEAEAQGSEPSVAVAELRSAAGMNVTGTVRFEKAGDNQVRVIAQITGLAPGKHGFHIHEFGDCSAPDFTSAGAHFNPTGASHGAPHDAQHHSGDFGNLEADEQGRAELDMTVDFLEWEGPNSFIGKAVVVHAEEDDLKSQPSGNAGGRVACGVIQTTG